MKIQDYLTQPSAKQLQAFDILTNCDQGHLMERWGLAGAEEDSKSRMLDQVLKLNAQYPGGLKQYCNNAKKLLAASKRGDNPYEGFRPAIPAGKVLVPGEEEYEALEQKGLEKVGHLGFVLVAGGLGERLGYSGIKIALPSEITTGKSFIQCYIETILAYQDRARMIEGDDNIRLPLAIMTSGDTHELTVQLLKKHSNFGMDEDQLTIMKQEKVPSLMDNDAKFATSSDDPYEIETKPHGHGDVHVLMHQTGTAKKWLEDFAIRHIVFFQDTNGVVFNAILPTLGVSLEEGFEVNSITVPRRAGEAAGGIVKLESEGGQELTINVEYNQLDPLLKASGQSQGDTPDASGFSPYPGNINVLLFALAPYIENLEASGGMIPEFVNPKYADDAKNTFKKPTRLECMMQDYPKLLGPSARVGFTTFPREWCFSAVKNNVGDAASKSKDGLPPESASSGEMDLYGVNRWKLRMAGAKIEDATKESFQGVEVTPGPRVILGPRFACTLRELKEKVRGLSLSPKSTLVIEGAKVRLCGVDLDGRLVIGESVVELKDEKISNDGDRLLALETGAPEELEIRGYQLSVLGEKRL